MAMAWSREQLEAVYRNVYAHAMTCPACGGALTLARAPDADAVGAVTCAACEERVVVSMRDDPLRERFRDFTEQEKKAIVAADKMRRTPHCPVDGTAMDVNVQRSLGRNSNVVVRCRRCTRSVEFTRLQG
jgi:transcription elongation factor Elf1